MRWPWESEADYKARLNARTERVKARQQGRSSRVEDRTGVRVAREEARAEGGYYSAEAVAARQGTVQKAIDAGLTAGEGVAKAFGYNMDLDGSDSAPAAIMPASGGGASMAGANADGTIFGMDRTTVLLAGAGVIALVVFMGRKG